MRDLKDICEIMGLIPKDWQKNWCEVKEGCACVGCVNGGGVGKLIQAGKSPKDMLSRDEWKLWMRHYG